MQNYKNNSGNAAIEFAIILPILLIIAFAIMEFGTYFIKDQIALNGIGSISASLQQDAGDADIEVAAREYGGGFMSFDTAPNYFCAQAYDDRDAAKNGSCVGGWDTERPGGADEPYFIAIAAQANKFKIIFSEYLPDIHREAVVRISPSRELKLESPSASHIKATTCNGNYAGGFCDQPYETNVTFSEPFDSPPHVIVGGAFSNTHGASCGGSTTDRDASFAKNVTRTGFTMVCSSSPGHSCGAYDGWWLHANCDYIAMGY